MLGGKLLLNLLFTLVVLSKSCKQNYVEEEKELAWGESLRPPVVVNTWNFTSANRRAWEEIAADRSALDAVESGCGQCELDQCDGTVGWGGSPSESAETTLDAMIMDGESYDVGAVGGLRRIKGAISVARLVLERSRHSLLVGELATQFALGFGFKEESLASNKSLEMHRAWLARKCQPNFWKNVSPNPADSCGPYHIPDHEYKLDGSELVQEEAAWRLENSPFDRGHDTIGMLAMDSRHRLAAGTSTNGARFKIPGRVGDSPIAGAGAYAAKDAGAAAATGDGDIMMRFLLSYQAVENLRQNMTAREAALDVISRQVRRTGRPYPMAGVVVLSRSGDVGAACCGMQRFPFVVSDSRQQVRTLSVECLN